MRNLVTPEALDADLDALSPCILSRADMALCRDAEDLLDRAQARSERWEAAAKGRYQTTLAQARQSGHEAGITAATDEIASMAAALLALEEREEERARDLASQVIHALFDGLHNSARIAAAARRALAENPRVGGGRLTVHPSDADGVVRRMAGTEVDISQDATLAPGVARLDTVLGIIHLSPDRQLAVAMTLLHRLSGSATASTGQMPALDGHAVADACAGSDDPQIDAAAQGCTP